MVSSSAGQTASAARWRRGSAVALGFVALTVFFSWPFPLHLATHIVSRDADLDLLMWAIGWNVHAFLHQPFSIFDANIFYPARHTLAYSENMIGSALLVAPIVWLTDNLVLAINFVQFSSVPLSAFGAYLLARKLGLGVPAAILVGLIFGFAPARYFRMPQTHITTIQWIPFCLAFLVAYFRVGGRPRHLRLAVLFFTAQTLTSGHGAVFLAVAVVCVLAYRLALGEPLAIVRWIRDLGVPGALALLPTFLIVLPYRAAQADVPQLERRLDDFSSPLSSYVSSLSVVHQWLFSHAPDWLTTPPPNAYLFIGVLPLVLALVALVTVRPLQEHGTPLSGWREKLAVWRDHPVPLFGFIGGISFWFMLGPPIGLWRWTYWLPIFSFMRVPSRFVMLATLAVAVLAGFGYQRLARSLTPSRQRLLAAVLGALLVFEFAPPRFDLVRHWVEPQVAEQWLNTQPKPFSVAEVPMVDTDDAAPRAWRDTLFMLHSAAHWQKTVHGYSGVEPQHYADLYPKLRRFPDEDSLNALLDLNVTYVVVHFDLYDDVFERVDVEARLDDYTAWLDIAFVSRDARVYRLQRPLKDE